MSDSEDDLNPEGKHQKWMNENGAGLVPIDSTPWPEPVNGNSLMESLIETFTRYVVLPDHGAFAAALWVLFSHAHEAFGNSPILGVTSPDKGCGKTTVLSLLTGLVPRPLSTSNISTAALFRCIERCHPTLIVDEVDSFLGGSEELRGILNSGHTRSTAYVIRTVGRNFDPHRFATWAPKVIALIGELPPTLADRSIIISMRRKRRNEDVDRLPWDCRTLLSDLRLQCARWAADHESVLKAANPFMPTILYNRGADNWRPLLAIAEVIGADWSETARMAAECLSEGGLSDDTAGVMLLADIRTICQTKQDDRIESSEIAYALAQMEERPWPEWKNGKSITPNQVARLLRPYGVISSTIRFGSGTARGYMLAQFADAWGRYLQPLPSETPQHANTDAALKSFRSETGAPAVLEEDPFNPALNQECFGVSDQEGWIASRDEDEGPQEFGREGGLND